MRLTYKDPKTAGGYNSVASDDFACVTKLGQLEDIEEELGIDLVTLFKALKDGIFVDGHSEREYVFLDVNEKELFTINDFECTYFAASLRQYGKFWALTKEELK